MDTEWKHFVDSTELNAAEVPDILKQQRARDESVRKPERRNTPSALPGTLLGSLWSLSFVGVWSHESGDRVAGQLRKAAVKPLPQCSTG